MKELLLYHIISLGIGILLDQVIGDPYFLPHPIRAIGSLISYLERRLLGSQTAESETDQENKPLESGLDRDVKKEKRKGILLWIIVELVVISVTFLIIFVSYRVNKYLGIGVEAILTCYILAARSLCRESMAVSRELEKKDIRAARKALSMIVGRDTAELEEEEIAKAAVETVAENTSDGVIAPLFYTAIGGPVLGFAYKAINTMDSMLGYRNERYENFGWLSAKADDVLNFIPSRLSAIFMILSAFVMGLFSKVYSGAGAYRIWKRDRLKHLSPNSAQTESVCAGALGIRLGGAHLYGGVMVEKPSIGDELRKTETADIKRANNLMFATEAVAAMIIFVILAVIFYIIPSIGSNLTQ